MTQSYSQRFLHNHGLPRVRLLSVTNLLGHEVKFVVVSDPETGQCVISTDPLAGIHQRVPIHVVVFVLQSDLPGPDRST